MATRKLEVVITGDASQLNKTLGNIGKKSAKFGAAFGASAIVASKAMDGLMSAGKAAISEFFDAQKVMAQTEAVLKSTGSAANVTADQVSSLAESLMKKSGVDDEAIQSGENMLLTFTRIRNEVGEGNDIFNQATEATLDLSVAMGKDMQSSAILVGKALNDPIKGMSALSKAGIQFTEEQKDTIKAMVASGNAMGAQKMILKELETQFGGSAEAAGETFSGQINIAKQTALNFAGDIVGRLIPVLQDLVAFIRENWPRIREIIENVTRDIRAIWKQWGDEIMAVVNFMFPLIKGIIENALKFIQNIWNLFAGILTGDWDRAWKAVKAIVTSALDNVILILGAVLPLLLKAAKALGSAILDGIVDVVKALPGAVWNLTKAIGEKYVEMYSTVLGWGFDLAKKIVGGVVDGLLGIGTAAWNVVNNIGSVLIDVRNQIIGWGKGIANAIKDGIIDGLEGLGNLIWDKVKDAWNFAKGKLSSLGSLIPGQGDASDPNFNPFIVPPTGAMPPGQSGNMFGALESMRPYANAAAGYGLTVTSGRTNHSKYTASGNISDHWYGKALDVAGSAAGMAGFFRSLIGNPAVKQAFYDPLGSIFGGQQSVYRQGGHDDHVHVATYDRGGVLKPGWTLAHNGTGRNEYVSRGGGGTYVTINMPNYLGNERDAARAIRDELRNLDRVETGGRSLNSRVTLT
jgi:phage-related protein